MRYPVLPKPILGHSKRSSARLAFERLEQKNLLAAGDFLRVIENPSTTLQPLSEAGSSVAIDGGIIAVGAPWDDSAGKSDIGQVHLYEQSTGQTLRSLRSQRPVSGGRFGQSIDIFDGKVAVSTPFSNVGAIDAGLVEVFDVAGDLTRTLLNPTPAPLDYFGWSLAADGDYIVVGAYLDDAFGLDAGAAHVFSASSGDLLYTLGSPEIHDSDYFGFSISLSDGVVAVGARRADVGAVDDGAVYLFDVASGEFLREIDNPTPQNFDSFGRSVSISGDLLVVGADGDNTGAAGSGAAYVFSVSTGELLHSIINPSPTFVDFFGASVAISQDQVVVGAIRADGIVLDAGAAYAFSTQTGELVHTWNNPTPGELDVFGASVAIDDGVAVVGAYWDDTAGTDAGAAYAFRSDTGELAYEFLSPTLSAFSYFGYSVAVSGDLVAAGAPFEDIANVTDVGVVFLSNAKTGELIREIANPDPVASDAFGYSLAASGDLLVVGAHRANDGATDSGVVYVFNMLTGDLVSTLRNPTPATQDFFGLSVDIWNERVVVGAHRKDASSGVSDAGAAYLFDAYSGELISTLENPDPDAFDYFGYSVAIHDERIAVGAYQDDHGAFNAGSVYVFDSFDPENARHVPNPDPMASDQFGYSVSMWDKHLAVGAPRKDIGDFDAGAVYLIHAVSGAEQHVIFDVLPRLAGNFGGEVSLSGDLLAVGAHQRDFPNVDGAGSVDLFDVSTGTLRRQLSAPSPMEDDFFGWSVAVGSNLTAVGTPLVDGATTDRGAVSVFFSQANAAPFALAGGPYVADEGELVVLQALGLSDDRDTVGELIIEWDLDYDGSEFNVDATGASPQLTFETGFAVRDIGLRVTDGDGAEFITTSPLMVNSTAPSISATQSAITADEGQRATNSGSFYDAGGDVQLSASIGELAANEDGTWDWYFDTADGPDDSQMVVVTATGADGLDASVEFALVVENRAPNLSVNQSVVYVLDGFDPEVAGTVTDIGNDEIVSMESNVGFVTNLGDGTWSWEMPADAFVMTQVVEVQALDSDGGRATVTFEVIPSRIVADLVSLTVEGGTLAAATGRYSRIEGTELVLAANVGTIVDDLDGNWSWSYPTVDGPEESQLVSIVAEYVGVDSSEFFMTMFGLVVLNVAPSISVEQPVVSVVEGGEAHVSGDVLDRDGDRVTLSASIGTVVDNGDGTWDWFHTAGVESVEQVHIAAEDEDGDSSIATFELSIENAPPVLVAGTDLVRVLPSEEAAQSGTFSDFGEGIVTLDASVGTVTDHGDGTWSWTYTPVTTTDAQSVTITATDSDEGSASVIFDLLVTNLVVDTNGVASTEGDVVRQTGRYAIPAGGELQLSASVGEIVDNGDGTWEWSYQTTDGPDESQNVTVWSSYPDSAVFLVDFEVVIANAAPVASASAVALSAFVGEGASNSGTFFDPGGDAVELSASAGKVIDRGGGNWEWSIDDVGEIGVRDVVITFTDDDESMSEIVFSLETLPRIESVADSVSVNEGSVAQLAGIYFDSGESVTLSASLGVIVDEGEWNWTWALDTSEQLVESQVVTLSADYGDDRIFSHAFELLVRNQPPQLTVAQDVVDVRDGELAVNHGVYVDVAFDDVELSASSGVLVDHLDGTWSWSMETTDGPDDSQVVTIVARDSDGDESEIEFEVLDSDVTEGPTALDLHQDGVIDVLDLDAIVAAIVGNDPDSRFDVSGDGVLGDADIEFWLANAAPQLGFGAPLLVGDANLDGTVNAADLNAMALGWQGDASTWSEGDFNADGRVNAADLNALAINWRRSIGPFEPAAAAIPNNFSVEDDSINVVSQAKARETVFEQLSESTDSRVPKTPRIRPRRSPSFRSRR